MAQQEAEGAPKRGAQRASSQSSTLNFAQNKVGTDDQGEPGGGGRGRSGKNRLSFSKVGEGTSHLLDAFSVLTLHRGIYL